MTDRLGLAEGIESLRLELLAAVYQGQGQKLQFGLGPIEVAFQVEVTKGGDGKIGWSILGAGAKYEKATTQTITLTLAPSLELPSGGVTTDVKIADAGKAGDLFGPDPD